MLPAPVPAPSLTLTSHKRSVGDRGLEDDDGLQPRGQGAPGLVLLQASWYEHGRVRACEDGPVQHGHPVGQAGEGAAIRISLRRGGRLD